MNKVILECQKEIDLYGKRITYTHKVSRSTRTMKLAVYRDGRCVVTTPKYLSESSIIFFITKKADWIFSKIEYFKNNTKEKVNTHSLQEIDEYKKIAKEIIHEKLPLFAQYYGVIYKNVVIKNVTTRWGSCSSKGNLNFNYKIALLPEELVDYIVVHELCHLKEMNHSKNFWQLVEEKIPNYRDLRKQLKTYT